MKVLLTGFSGNLGQALAGALLAGGHQVRALLNSRAIDRRDLDPRLEIIWGSLYDHDRFGEFTNGVDAVIHSAWEPKQWPEEGFEAANFEGTVALYRAAAANRVGHFVQISTIGVFGLRPREDGQPMVEDSPHASREASLDVYPWTKIRIERKLNELAERSPTRLTIVRPGLLFSDHKVPAKRLLRIGKHAFAVLVGSSRNHLPYVHVDDVADLVVRLLSIDKSERVYNAVPSRPISAAGFARSWGRRAGLSLRILRIPASVFTGLSLFGFHLKRLLGRRAFRPNTRYQAATATRDVIYSCERAQLDLDWVDRCTREISESAS